MSKSGQLALVLCFESWQEYQEELSQELGEPSHVAFAGCPEPIGYPCLVAAQLTEEQKFVCCYVYPRDAARLREAQEGFQGPHGPFYEDGPSEPIAESVATDYAPTPAGILLLALMLEMKAVGVLKKANLFPALAKAERWLKDNEKQNREDASLAGMLQRLWQDDDAN